MSDNFTTHWALLVAGSCGWNNYRHQADICHAYHVLNNNGIPDERIVVMMYDDIAFNTKNIMKGRIINSLEGEDVYAGVPKDYTGALVTPEVFLDVLQGTRSTAVLSGSGKVINSGFNDNIFVYFADHGAQDLVCFPSANLYKSELSEAIMNMHANKKYKNMVFYIEACESGSMFSGFSSNLNVYATTAANEDEPSYACYYQRDLGVFLGDIYSVSWMEYSDRVSLSSKTILDEFNEVKWRVDGMSHPQQYGDLSINKLHLSEFQGDSKKVGATKPSNENIYPKFDNEKILVYLLTGFFHSDELKQISFAFKKPLATNSVHSRETTLHSLKYKVEHARNESERKEAEKMLEDEHSNRAKIEGIFKDIREKCETKLKTYSLQTSSATSVLSTDAASIKGVIDHVLMSCPTFRNHEFFFGHLSHVVSLCKRGVPHTEIKSIIDKVCV